MHNTFACPNSLNCAIAVHLAAAILLVDHSFGGESHLRRKTDTTTHETQTTTHSRSTPYPCQHATTIDARPFSTHHELIAATTTSTSDLPSTSADKAPLGRRPTADVHQRTWQGSPQDPLYTCPKKTSKTHVY